MRRKREASHARPSRASGHDRTSMRVSRDRGSSGVCEAGVPQIADRLMGGSRPYRRLILVRLPALLDDHAHDTSVHHHLVRDDHLDGVTTGRTAKNRSLRGPRCHHGVRHGNTCTRFWRWETARGRTLGIPLTILGVGAIPLDDPGALRLCPLRRRDSIGDRAIRGCQAFTDRITAERLWAKTRRPVRVPIQE